MRNKTKWLAPLFLLPLLAHAQTGSYSESNLISDGSVTAQRTDPTFLNPWGVAIGQQTPFWINTTDNGLSQVWDGGANKQFVVQVPAAAGGTKTGTPTGIALNPSTTDFALPQAGAATFLFDSLDGTISGWNSSVTNAVLVANNSASGAVYTGLAIENNGTANFLLAANFASGKIDVLDAQFKPAKLSGSFSDPGVPAGFAPFNVHVVGNQVFVAYGQQPQGGGPAVRAAGAGYVSVFDVNGNVVSHAISGGNLNAPWGVAVAPASFGQFAGALLIGNFGDGTINAYDPKSFALLGQLKDATGAPIQHDRLWEILFGQNGTGDPNTLYFSAGINDEKGGLFGAIVPSAPVAAGDFQVTLSAPTLTVAAGASGSLKVQIAPTAAFSSPVTFTATGLPTGMTAQFSPATVTPTAGAAATTTLTVAPASAGTPGAPPSPYVASAGTASSTGWPGARFFLPLGLAGLLPLVLMRRRTIASFVARGGGLALLALAFTLTGCGGGGHSSAPTTQPVPVATGTSTVTVTATSGAIVHSTTFTLTVQ